MTIRLAEERSPKIKRKIDYIGMALLGAGLLSILYALTEITWIWNYNRILDSPWAVGGVIIAGFALWERYTHKPLIQASVLKERVLVSSILASFFQSLASFAVLFLIIMYLHDPRNMTPSMLLFC